MSETPIDVEDGRLYVLWHSDFEGGPKGRRATVSDVRAAVLPLIDYEAAANECRAWFRKADGTLWRKESEVVACAYSVIRVALEAALKGDIDT